ncbi:MAG TPA: tetratricopeptide repeat protein [Solimonas sp.]|nr:tetratricopeptide repeat protein [Solimonas sp.]
MSLRNAIALLGLLALSPLQAAEEAAPTVGSVTEHNGLRANGWLLVQTPSILRVETTPAPTPDLAEAIAQYEKILQLPAAPAVRAEALRRSADLRLRLVEAGGEAAPEQLAKAMSAYRQLLAEQPDYVRADRVLYQLARASSLAGEEEQAIASLRQLGQRHPQSARRGDALFRAAELLFRERRYAEAEPQYREVVALGESSPLFDTAQYKYGWSLYQQGKHEQALPVFLAVLERALPPGALDDPQAALAAVKGGRGELAAEALRVTGLSLAALGGGAALNAQFARQGEPRFAPLLHAALGEQLLEKRRYTEAAGAYLAFIERQPRHALAPVFQRRAIAAYQRGGFTRLQLAAQEGFVEAYAPDAAYWQGRTPPPELQAEVRKGIEELGRHYQAGAQQARDAAGFLKAASWYRRWLALYPKDAGAAQIQLLYADALLDGGQPAQAAQEYARLAWDYPAHAKSAEAAQAAVQAWQQLAAQSEGKVREDALRHSVADSLRLAAAHPQHPQWSAVLARTAADLQQLGEHAQALEQAQRLLDAKRPLTPEQARSTLAIVADARYAQRQYAEAEAAYAALLRQLPPGDATRQPAVEQLAAAIYRQGEAAREAGELRAAAQAFARVGRAAPEAGIRATADYDAAAAWMALQDWPQAQAALESFRARWSQHPLIPEADRKLALAYHKGARPALAAEAYARIAQRATEPADLRRDAAWLSAELYDQARLDAASRAAYERYVAAWPQPLEPALRARRRLADLAREAGDGTRQGHWLREIVAAENSGAAARNPQSKLLAAQASLELGRLDAAAARALPLRLPVAKSLAQRKALTETAIAALDRAAAAGFAEITTAATYDLGSVYRDLGRAMLNSERPRELRGEALEQYELLLEEQAYPFEEKAIRAHEANLQRLRQGLWNEWIRRSSRALAELVPARYGKQDQREVNYEALLR